MYEQNRTCMKWQQRAAITNSNSPPK